MPLKTPVRAHSVNQSIPMAGRVISANLERYNQVAKVTRQTIAAMRKRFAGSTPVRSSHHQHIIKMNKPTFSKRVSGGTRIYYIDTHKDSNSSPYIVISEVPTDRSKGPQKRQRIFLHPEHLEEFQDALNAAIDNLKNDIER